MKTGWYGSDEYIVVKPLKNGYRQSLIVGVQKCNFGRWYVMAGVFSSYATYNTMSHSEAWIEPMSTNKNPSIKVLTLALEALNEIEQELHEQANGKRTYIYVDGLDKRRLRVYTKVLTKKCGYKISSVKSDHCELPMIYKKI